jgi:predicted TIM-barrel fold metal-dependent hydrolase
VRDADDRTWDARRRLEHMDDFGIYSQVLYPNIGVFQVNEYIGMQADPQLVLECVRAYNDFLVEWSSIAPDRYIPLMTVPFWNFDATIAELHRAHAAGHRGVVFPARMEDFRLPPLSDSHWDPFWAAAQDLDLSINFHIGSGNIPMFGTNNTGKHLSYAWTGSMLFFLNANAIVSLIFGGVCQRFPRLKFVSVESGVGWVPFLLEGMDWQFHNAGAHLEHPELELLPSEYFARQIYTCFWFERASARAAIEQLGADHVMFETDFPHSTGITPGPASAALAPREHPKHALAGLPDDVIRKVIHDNAALLYRVSG